MHCLLMVAHPSLFTEVVFIVFILLQVLRYMQEVPFHGRVFNEANLGQSSLLKESARVALHSLGLVNSIQHTCNGTCFADQFSRSCI